MSKENITFFYKKIQSPLGELTIVANGKNLVSVLWENDNPKRVSFSKLTENKNQFILCETERQLEEYFFQKRKTFNLPLEFYGTVFQKKVWLGLQTISYGSTASYGDLAKKIGNSKASRAVGAANGRNPLSIIVPCHRVIGGNGSLTGFAGGLHAKSYLLNLETAL